MIFIDRWCRLELVSLNWHVCDFSMMSHVVLCRCKVSRKQMSNISKSTANGQNHRRSNSSWQLWRSGSLLANLSRTTTDCC